jgi:site-specific recombinase XerD
VISERSKKMDYIKNFEEYLTEKGKAKKTVESYNGDLRGYFGFLTNRDIVFEGIVSGDGSW